MIVALFRNQPPRRAAAALVLLLVLVLMTANKLLVVAHWPSTDWSSFGADFVALYASAGLVIEGRSAEVYSLETQSVAQKAIKNVSGLSTASGPDPIPMPFPPAFLLPVLPFTILPPVPAFALWTLISMALVAVALRRIAVAFGLPAWFVCLVATGFFPLVSNFILGQVSGMLLLGFTEAYRGWQERKEFVAGLGLAMLLVKPQYLVLLVIVLVWKRRWQTLAGLFLASVVLSAVSLLVGGVQGIRGYLSLLLAYAAVGGLPSNYVEAMVSWRGLLFNLLSSAPGGLSLWLIVILSVGTGLLALIPWRSANWEKMAQPQFALLMLGLTAATLLIAYHSHSHSVVLLLVPALHLCSILAKDGGVALGRLPWVLDVVFLGPSLLFGTILMVTGLWGWAHVGAGSGTALILAAVVLWVAFTARRPDVSLSTLSADALAAPER